MKFYVGYRGSYAHYLVYWISVILSIICSLIHIAKCILKLFLQISHDKYHLFSQNCQNFGARVVFCLTKVIQAGPGWVSVDITNEVNWGDMAVSRENTKVNFSVQ